MRLIEKLITSSPNSCIFKKKIQKQFNVILNIKKKNNGRRLFERGRNSKILTREDLRGPARRSGEVEAGGGLVPDSLSRYHEHMDERAHTRASRCIRRERFRKYSIHRRSLFSGPPPTLIPHIHILSLSLLLSLSLAFFLSPRLSFKTRF